MLSIHPRIILLLKNKKNTRIRLHLKKTPNMNPYMGTLVLIRHGKSEFNLKKIFTGWMDAPLADQGKAEAHHAAENLKGFHFDIAFTSALSRAQDTLQIVLEDLGQTKIPVIKDEALNERHYGDLQGKNKDATRKEFGEEQVHIWRRSYDVPPPNGESLKDTCERTIPYLTEKILPEVQAGKTVIVAAHGNSLRSIVKELEELNTDEIIKIEIPTGVPHVYEFDEEMKLAKKTILHHDMNEEKEESAKVQ
jgi:2,3-bisphosphoglycerate-dependent phosphoglycerate mutase